MAIKFLIDGVEYFGIKPAAEKLGTTFLQLRYEINNGVVNNRYTVVSKYKYGATPVTQTAGSKRSVTINGVKYLSLRSACTELNIEPSTLYKWMKKVPKDEPLIVNTNNHGGRSKSCVINGVRYESYAAAANALNITKDTITRVLARRGVDGVVNDYIPRKV